MGQNSHISWTTHTFNSIHGCTKVSLGCKNCYAETLSKRFGKDIWGPTAARLPMSVKYWHQLILWDAAARKAGRRDRVFCNSMSDLFEGPETCQNAASYQVVADGRRRLLRSIPYLPNLTFLLLTKRTENILPMVADVWQSDWPQNAWIGTSVEDQENTDRRVALLRAVPAPIHFLSVEPMLGQVTLPPDFLALGSSAWVIAGGESGHQSRPGHADWYRRLRDQAVAGGVPFHFKQHGNWLHDSQLDNLDSSSIGVDQGLNPARLYVRGCQSRHDWSDGSRSFNVGKKEAGRLLDSRTWDEMPEVSHAL